MLGLFHYRILCDVLSNVHLLRDRQAVADFVLMKVAQALNAEGGTIFLMNEGGLLTPSAAYGAPLETLKSITFPVGQGLVGWVVRFKEPLKVDDVKSDARFSGAADRRTNFDTRSVVAAPILFGEKVEGAIEFLNKKDGRFTDADLELISILGREIGSAFEKAALEENVRRNTALEWAVNNFHAGVIVADPNNMILTANARAREILNTESFQLAAGGRLDELANSWPELAHSINQVIETTLPIARQETQRYPSKIVGFSCVPVTDREGTLAGAALLLQDITPAAARSASN
ncbi:MAG: GAF domain-containing protein [Elusimicrobia bacterium]|nr:GAF domain-containing protein [Elusimicrobiota bacterium]